MPLLSVVIPTYNRAKFLERCLRSVLACSLEDIEILVADNASTDTTQEVLKSFCDHRLRFWRNETNVGAARNVLSLLQVAHGEWIFLIGDDDLLLPNALERLASIVQSDPDLGVVLSSFKVMDIDGNYLWDHHFYSRTAKFSAGMEALSRMVSGTHSLTRITVRRKWLDLSGTERHLNSAYPQTYFVGAILKEHPGFYLDEYLTAVTHGNQGFWGYPKDFMVKARIEMIKDMLPGMRWKDERKVLINQIIDEIGKHHMPLSWDESVPNWMRHQFALLRKREVALSPRYWFGLLYFIATLVAQKLFANRSYPKFLRRLNDWYWNGG